MAAGFEVRNHTTKPASPEPEVMFTIQVLAADPGWPAVNLEAAQQCLTAAYASAFAGLAERVEAASNGGE